MDVKDTVCQVAMLSIRSEDMLAYYTADQFATGFKKRPAFQLRGITWNSGSSCEGIWITKRQPGSSCPSPDVSGYMYTSCTSACSVATGPPYLDTGQIGEVAKLHPGDPLWEMRIVVPLRSKTGVVEDSTRARHVGIPPCLQLTSASLDADHGPYCGVRVGEASHPGPSGGAARATDRRREERVSACDDGDALGLTSILRPLIEKLLREVLRDLLGGGGMKQLVAGMLAGEQPAARRSTTASPPDGDEAMDEDYRKGARWKKRRKRDEAAGDASQAHDGEKAAGKGKNDGGEKAAGKGKNAGGEKAGGKGKNAGGESVGKGKGSGGEVQPPKGRGRGAEDGGDAKGKGKASGAKPDVEADGGWQEVPSRQWELRAEDLTEPVLSYDAVVGAFAADSTDAIKGVVLVDAERAETLKTLLRGTSKAHAVLLVVPDREAKHRCPGSAGGKVTYRQVSLHESFTAGLCQPQPRALAKVAKLEPKKSSVVYVRYLQRYMTPERWKEVKRNPQVAFHAFLANNRLRALDSWGWMVEDVAGTPYQRIFGSARLQDSDIPTLLGLSGRLGTFIDAARGFAMGPVMTQWCDQLEKESATDYLARVLTVSSPFGLVAGNKQLGKRLARDPNVPVMRHWLIDGVPGTLSADEVMEVLQAAGFEEIAMVLQRRRGGHMEYHFKAKATFATDSLAIPLEMGEDRYALWARVAPPKRGKVTPQTIATSGMWKLEPAKPRWATERVALGEDGEEEENATILDSGSTTTDAVMPETGAGTQEPADATNAGPKAAAKSEAKPKDPKDRRDGAKGTARKKQVVQQRSLPADVQVVSQPDDGNCLFHAAANAVSNLDGGKCTAAEVRAKVVNHFGRHKAEYTKSWDGELPNREASDSFDAYMSAIEKDRTWGGLLELRAIARIYDLRLVVFATPLELEPFHLHGQQRKRVVALRFNGRHYDLLVGSNGKLPKALLDIRAKPEEVPLRGGGGDTIPQRLRGGGDDASVCAPSSRASVWTRPSASVRSCSTGSRPKSVPPSQTASVWSRPSAATGSRLTTRAPCATPAASRSSSARGARNSEAPAAGPSDVAASVGRRASSAHNAPARASSAGARTFSTAEAGTLAMDDPLAEDSLDGEAGADARPRLALAAYYKRGSMLNPACKAPGLFEDQCRHCAQVFRACTAQRLGHMRYDHYSTWHPTEPRFHSRSSPDPTVRRLHKDEQADWRCPLCTCGLPRGSIESTSKLKVKKARDHHRETRHPDVTLQAFVALCRARGLRRPAVVMRRRAATLNRGVTKRVREDDPRLRPFTWPKLCKKNKAASVRLKLISAWRCSECVACFVNLKPARRHRCANTLQWRVRSRLRALIRSSSGLRAGLRTASSPSCWMDCSSWRPQDVGRRAAKPMIVFATLNVQLAAAAKVNSIIGLFGDERPLDVLCCQELGLDEPSAPSFISMAESAGLHVFLGAVDNGRYRVAVISRFSGTSVRMHSSRTACARFQLLSNGSFVSVLVASYYGCVHDEEAAMAGARDAIEQLKLAQTPWILLGDFNLETRQAPMLGELAAGLAFSWDEAFETEALLPGTRESGRRVDYALGCGRFFPTAVHQCWSLADHAMVWYEVVFESCTGLRAPAFRRLRSTEVPEESWRAVWQAQAFEEELAAGRLNEAWTRLSDTAEDLLAEDGSHGPRRSQLWRPLTRVPQRSKAALPGAAVLVVRLRRLQRRLCQLLRFPGDRRLRDKTGRQLSALCIKLPWLAEIPYFEMERWGSWVRERADELEQQQKVAAIGQWRERLSQSEPAMVTWVRKREKLEVELARPKLEPALVHSACAVHPACVVRDAEAAWMRRWGRCGAKGQVDELIAAHPALPERQWAARATAGRRAAGSLRQTCCRRREAALEWEKLAHRSLRSVADRWASA